MSPARRRGRALRLLVAEPLPPVPDALELLGTAVRRPGELHDALTLSASAVERLARAIASCQLPADVLGSVMLEASLIAEDLGEARFSALAPTTGAIGRGLSAAEADYLRLLTVGRAGAAAGGRECPGTIAVPVRLTSRLAVIDVAEALRRVEAERALSWEVAAVIEGRTLGECVLLRAAGG